MLKFLKWDADLGHRVLGWVGAKMLLYDLSFQIYLNIPQGELFMLLLTIKLALPLTPSWLVPLLTPVTWQRYSCLYYVVLSSI